MSDFNGKLERTQRPETMTPVDWTREYGIEKEKEFSELFDSKGGPLSNDPELFETYVEKIPTEMKKKSIFYEILYWEHLKIVHLLVPMHIF